MSLLNLKSNKEKIEHDIKEIDEALALIEQQKSILTATRDLLVKLLKR